MIKVTSLYVLGENLNKFDDIEKTIKFFETTPVYAPNNYKAIGVEYDNGEYIGSVDILSWKEGNMKISNDYKVYKLESEKEIMSIVERLQKEVK